MFDTTCANRKAFNAHGIERPPTKWEKPCRVGFIEWEEHCVECGQPECFRTCKMFERSYDGKCRRFACGIVKLRGLGYGIKFKQWGKIEGVYTGRYISRRTESVLSCIDRVLSKCAQYVNRIMGFIPGRIGAITIYRRIKLWSERLIPGDKSKQLHGIVMRVFAGESVELHLVLIADEQEKFSTVVHFESGWNEIGVETPAIVRGARILLFSTSSKEFTLVFDSLELVQRVNRGEDKQLKTQICASPHAKYVKCVAWDLDNTVWSGILVEDGVEGLRINENVINTIKSLDRRGIVNTIMSKNDYDCAWKCLEKFGISEYFVFPHINWMPKSGNLKALANEMNIGLDTLAFVDDSSFERGEVSETLPMVRVFSNLQVDELLARQEFNPPTSAESAKRRQSYQKEMQRNAAAASFAGDYGDFLRSCEIKLAVFNLVHATNEEYGRCYELIQRTNQLTLAGRRYSESAFRDLVMQDGMQAFGIRCTDRFGDYGIVGAVLFRSHGQEVCIEEFVMSCRVAKKRCETAIVSWIVGKARESGASIVVADLVKTGRNGALISAFNEIDGMIPKETETRIRYEKILSENAEVAQVVTVIET